MNQPSISVENVWKRYRKGQTGYHTLREDIYNITGRIISLGGEKKRETDAEHIWALRDVSFQIEQGERVGIIGRNGSGKTTMLRLLAGITRPNHGKITVKGRLGVLIEIMAGFHPELSGRENVYLNGAIMGMSQKEIKRKFDEIVAFAELENFIDTPIKRYSSGMHVRLGFSVAAHLDPDILLVDEVLAVGDAAFQKKCLGKMGSAAQEGRTVVFVSHNMNAVKNLCNRAIELENGNLILDSESNTVIEHYLKNSEICARTSQRTWDNTNDQPGDERFRLIGIRVLNENIEVRDIFSSSRPILVEFEFTLTTIHSALTVGFDLYTSTGEVVLRSYNHDRSEKEWPSLRIGRNVLRCTIPPGLLNAGDYLVAPRVGLHCIEWIINSGPVVRFSVRLDHSDSPFWNLADVAMRPGVISPCFRWDSVEE